MAGRETVWNSAKLMSFRNVFSCEYFCCWYMLHRGYRTKLLSITLQLAKFGEDLLDDSLAPWSRSHLSEIRIEQSFIVRGISEGAAQVAL